MKTSLCYATISVRSLDEARRFYEDTLGFERAAYWEPTRWQAYSMGGDPAGFAIIETADLSRAPSDDMIDFFVDDVEALWQRVRKRADVVSQLQKTPWGSHKFVVRDPDGHQLGFVQR